MNLPPRPQLMLIYLVLCYGYCNAFDLVGIAKTIFFPHLPQLSADDIKEASITPEGLIERAGYPAESHTVETKDGYLLAVHRIPHGKENTKTDDRIPVLFIPGHGCSSPMAVSGKNTSLGFTLAESGFDVWLGNFRGNRYSRKHVTLSPEENDFWDFGFDEHANYDVGAMIKYVLKETGSEKLQLITHSSGALLVLMFLSRNPEYNQKVKGTVHLGPTVFYKYITTLYRPIFENRKRLFQIPSILGMHELSPPRPEQLLNMCPTEDPSVCYALFSSYVGYKMRFDLRKLPLYMVQCPSGFSLKGFQHVAQFCFSDEIRAWDFGSEEKNMGKYGQRKPPIYDLNLVTSPQALFYGLNDPMGGPLNTALLIQRLNSSIFNYIIPDPLFTHIDFLYADEGEKLVFVPLVETLLNMWTNRF